VLRAVATTEKMRTPATASAVLHASVLAVAFFGLPDLFSKPPLVEPEPVMIEFEAIDKKAAAPVVAHQPPPPKDAPIAEDTTKAPPPKTAEPPPAPEPPKPQLEQAVAPPPMPEPPKIAKPDPQKPQEDVIALKPKEPEPPKVEKPPEPPKPTPPQVKKPDPPKPTPPQPKPKTADSLVDDILKNQDNVKTPKTPEQAVKPPQQVTRQPTAPPQLAAVVTASEIEGVRRKVHGCWKGIGGAKEAPIITFIVDMKQDGTPTKAEIKDTGRYNNDPLYRALADAAWRAIMNPHCHPWPLPAEKYAGGWRTITFNFDPKDY
jgi:hypothetical protein